MRLLAIDPGPIESAYVLYDTETGKPVKWAKVPNHDLRRGIVGSVADSMAIEMVTSYGMAVGATVFTTCVWAGRFIERWFDQCWEFGNAQTEAIEVYRREVKLHLCASARAKDANIRQALIDRYGPGKDRAIGRKASPGPLYGLSGDCWAALGVAVTVAETRLQGQEMAA